MPVFVKDGLPAINELQSKGIHVYEVNSLKSDADIVRIGLLNLMPLKERTEKDFIRSLSYSPHNIVLDFIETTSYRGKHCDSSHLDTFYEKWTSVKHGHYDGFIVTGAPVEELDFADVAYWDEIKDVVEWCNREVRSTLYICWGAMAALYLMYGIRKMFYSRKLSGVYRHEVKDGESKLFSGFDGVFFVPHSRNCGVNIADVENQAELKILAASEKAGPHCIATSECKSIFLTGHFEYDSDTLDFEYRRDSEKNMNPSLPENYYIADDRAKGYEDKWADNATLFFTNWIEFFVKKSKELFK